MAAVGGAVAGAGLMCLGGLACIGAGLVGGGLSSTLTSSLRFGAVLGAPVGLALAARRVPLWLASLLGLCLFAAFYAERFAHRFDHRAIPWIWASHCVEGLLLGLGLAVAARRWLDAR